VAPSQQIESDSLIEFFELRARNEEQGGSVVVGRVDTGQFIELPALGMQIIDELRAGSRVADVEDSLLDQGIQLDVAGFAAQLREVGFIRAIDGVPDPDAPAARPPSLAWLKPGHVQWLFTRLTYALCLLIVAAAVAACVLDSRIRPRYSDIFISADTSVVLVGSTAIFLAVVALHEFAHLASARASGVPARISFGTRLYSLVAQTDVSGMWAASGPERLRTYLAGMGLDVVLASILILVRSAAGADNPADHVLAASVVIIIVGVAGQFQLFMRTDIYFVAAHVLKARNLFEDASVQLLHMLRSVLRRASSEHPLSQLPSAERRVVKTYAAIMITGTAGALAVFAAYLLPALVTLLIRGGQRLAAGIGAGDVPMAVDGGVTLLVEGGTEVLVVVLMLKSRMPYIARLRSRLRAAPGSSS
jgi:putative peptide zinc metalloprotease protein